MIGTYMKLIEENEKIIEDMELQLRNIHKSEIEKEISLKNIENDFLTEKIYEVNNEIFRYRNRILAVNHTIISKEETLRNQMAYIENMIVPPCGINYMDMPFNNRNYLVQRFYQELYIKYSEQPMELKKLGLVANSNERFLKVEWLDEDEKKQALILDKYLKICLAVEQLEALINYVKCIQFNFIHSET